MYVRQPITTDPTTVIKARLTPERGRDDMNGYPIDLLLSAGDSTMSLPLTLTAARALYATLAEALGQVKGFERANDLVPAAYDTQPAGV